MPPPVNIPIALSVAVPPLQGSIDKSLISRLRELVPAARICQEVGSSNLGIEFLLNPVHPQGYVSRERGFPPNPYIFSPKMHGTAINFTLKERYYGSPSS